MKGKSESLLLRKVRVDEVSKNQSTKNSAETKTIYSVLPVGESNAISSSDLANLVSLPNVRILQEHIARERESGSLILSKSHNGGGYFRPSPGAAGEAEIARFIATVRSRALNSLKILRGAKTALSGPEGQLDIDDLLTL